ncbi:hypothetical protein FPRO06_00296 [Fusarium proliferatum]|nr:hypothetical protein FPRO06_00296 [Fusarium proliferatum]
MADDNPAEASAAKPEAKPVNCHICNKSFPHKGSLRRHRQSKHPVQKVEADTSETGQDGEAAITFDCAICKQSFTRQSSLTQHQRSKHGPPKPEAPATSVTQAQAAEPRAEGSAANEASTSAKQEDANQGDKGQESKTTCSICNRSFSHRGALYQHKRTKHRTIKTDVETPAKEEDKAPDDEEKTIKCDVCDKLFTSRNSLRRHLKSKHASDKKGKGPAKSSEQGGKAAGSSKPVHTTLKERHIAGSQRFKCPCCNENFSSEDTLMKHQAEQRLEAMRKFMENMAMAASGMRVSNGQDGSDEESEEQEPAEETATEEKKAPNMHQCTLCDKNFRFKSALVQHGLIKHAVADDTVAESSGQGANATAGGKKAEDVDRDEDEDKPYCQTCQKTFRHAKGLADHRLNKHGIVETEPTNSKQDDDDEDDSDIDMDDDRGPPTLCTHCNEYFPQMSLVAHQWHVHSISHPAVVDVQAKIAKDESYGPKRTVCKDYPDANAFPFFFEAKYFLRECLFSCGQSFETGTERMNHEVEAHNRCITCHAYFTTRSTLENHQSKSKVVDTIVRDFDHWLEFAVPAQVHHEKQKEKAARNSNPNKNIDCITCDRKFEKASTMMKHVERGRCIPDVNEIDIFAVGQTLADRGAPCVRPGGFFCPICDKSYMVLSELILHAEGDECNLNVLRGPLRKLISLVMMDFMSMMMGHAF